MNEQEKLDALCEDIVNEVDEVARAYVTKKGSNYVITVEFDATEDGWHLHGICTYVDDLYENIERELKEFTE